MIILFFIILKLIHTQITPINDRKYKWQIHSFNDPREIKQLVRKGSSLFKIDLYYVPQGLCNTNDNRCTHDLRGCFLLTHDKPLNNMKYPNIFTYIDSIIHNQRFFKRRGIKFNLALCFKNTPNDVCNGKMHEWISLIDDLYIYLKEIILNYEIDLEIIYDGPKLNCIKNRWNDWYYTWIRKRDPDEAFYSNDSENYFYKFNIFNDFYLDLKNDSLLNYGKFKNIKRPLQIWEPNHQKSIQDTQKIFESNPHKFGYAFAINMDTSMYQVFSGEISNENLNHNFDQDFNSLYSIFEVVNEKMYFFNNQKLVLNVYFLNKTNKLNLEKSIPFKFLPKGELKEIIVINRKTYFSFLIFNKKGNFCENLINLNNLNVMYSNCKNINILKYIFQNNENSVGKKQYYGYFNPNSINFHIKILSVSLLNISNMIFAFVSNSKPNQIQIVKTNFNLNKQFLFFENNPYLSKTIILSKEIINIDIKCSIENCLLLYSLKENDNKINSFFLEIKNNEFKIIFHKYKEFGVGINYSLKVFNSPKDKKDKFFLVKDSSFCYHNEESNKNAYEFICDQKEISTPHVLNYIYGNLKLENEKDKKKIEINYSSVCSNYTLTGTYDRGDYPKISIFFINKEMNFIEVHNGINDNLIDLSIKCGLSNFYKGVVADNWNIGDVEEKLF